MWLFTKRGFYSAVEHREDPDVIIVRARVKADLEALGELNPDVPAGIWQDKTADYPWRVMLSRADWKALVAQLIDELDYANFKDAVTKRQGVGRHDVYLSVWGVLRRGLQPIRKFGSYGSNQLALNATLDADPGSDVPWDDGSKPAQTPGKRGSRRGKPS